MEFADKDACEQLDADHIAVKHLFVEYARLAFAMPQDSADERTRLAMRICSELTVHAQLEEDIFYPALGKAVPATAARLDEARQEHGQVKQMVARIQSLGSAGPQMDELVSQLAVLVEHHVKEERDELFPKAKAGIDLAALGERMNERRQALAASPQPQRQAAGRQ